MKKVDRRGPSRALVGRVKFGDNMMGREGMRRCLGHEKPFFLEGSWREREGRLVTGFFQSFAGR